MRATACLLLTSALLAACGADDQGVTASRDLLAREGLELLASPGSLVPEAEVAWGAAGVRGWHRKVEAGPEGQGSLARPWAARANAPEAELLLAAGSPEERELELLAWLPDAAGEVPLTVSLNGIELGRPSLTAEPRRLTLEAPAAAWRAGSNDLLLTTDQGALERRADGELAGLLLAEVTFTPARRIERGPDGLVLDPGTGLRLHFEERGAAALTLGLGPSAAGSLTLTARRLDHGGRPAPGEPDAALSLERTGAEGPAEHSWTLPAAEGALLEVELSWQPDAAGPLTLTHLFLDEALERHSPSIVLISIDTLAARHTSIHGYPRDTTPRLAAFAEQAVVFERCATNAPWTMPSYAALMTGYFPASARTSPHLTDTHFARTLPALRWTLAEALGAAGYRTGAFVDSPNVSAGLGFRQGFEIFDESALALAHDQPGGGIEAAAAAALSWLDGVQSQDPEAPVFLFLHANDVHGPYLPGAGELGHFRGDGHGLHPAEPLWTGALSGTFDQVPAYLLPSALGEADERPDRIAADAFATAYDESIRTLDRLLADFLADLDARGVLDEAVVIVTADHGEAFGQHGHLGHGLLYEEVLQVPLVVRLPGPDRAMGRVATPVQLVDLYPTLAELAGLGAERTDLHGRSLVPLLEGRELEPVPTYAEGGLMRQSSVTLGDWKLIELFPAEASVPWTMLTNPHLPEGFLEEHAPTVLEGPLDAERLDQLIAAGNPGALLAALREALDGRRLELYDLASDPGEAKDLFDERPDKVAELLPHLEAAAARLEETRLADEAQDSVRLSAEALAELEKLGY